MKQKKEIKQNKPTLEFKECNNAGDNIDALVSKFTNNILGEFILSEALKEVKKNNQKIEEYKNSLLN